MNIKYILIIWSFFLTTFDAVASQDDIFPVSKYKSQTNPYFTFTKFKRGFDNDSLRSTLDDLEKVSRKEWTRNDSLAFASASLKTGNLKLAEYYFENFRKTALNDEYWWDYMMLLLLTENYSHGLDEIQQKYPGILEYSDIYFLKKIFLANLRKHRHEEWHKTDNVLNWSIDSSLLMIDKNSQQFKISVINPLNNLNKVLHTLIGYIHSDDPILARVCYEMGVILENYITITQAYIAYNLGRNYNKWDKEILNAVKASKLKMSELQLKIPVFRRYFPRIEHWRFEYAVLKEKIIRSKSDTIHFKPPELVKKTKTKELPIPSQLIILIGLTVIFLLILIFVRTKK